MSFMVLGSSRTAILESILESYIKENNTPSSSSVAPGRGMKFASVVYTPGSDHVATTFLFCTSPLTTEFIHSAVLSMGAVPYHHLVSGLALYKGLKVGKSNKPCQSPPVNSFSQENVSKLGSVEMVHRRA